MPKVAFPVDKRKWSPSLIPGPIMLVSTIDADGEANVAPKSWVQMVAFDPPTLMFSGTAGHPTERNIDATGCFVLNVVAESMVESVVASIQWHGRDRIERAGWSLIPAQRVDAPLVVECPAHLECTLERTVAMGSGHVVFGRIVAASIDEAVLEAPAAERYAHLAQALFLADAVYGRTELL